MHHFETIPRWKMPDDCIIQDHKHHICLKIDFSLESNGVFSTYIGDLRRYYTWASENRIFMEHNILRQGKDGKRSTIMFVFKNSVDAIGFKLTWKEYR